MLSFPLTETAELRLLMPRHGAASAQLATVEYHHLKDWISWAAADYTVEMAQAFIKDALEQFGRNAAMHFAIFDEHYFAGCIGFNYFQWGNGYYAKNHTEIGYWLGHEYQGKGIMTRAVRALTGYAIDTLNINRVHIITDVRNTASAAIPKRLNYRHEGVRHEWYHFRDEWRDVDLWVMLGRDWRDMTKRATMGV